jgi:hypothetical protein
MRPALFFLTSELQRLTNWIRQSTQNWGYGINLSAITPTEVAIGIAVILLVVLAVVIDLSTRKRRTVTVRAPLSDAEYVRTVREGSNLRQSEMPPAEQLERAERAQPVVALHIVPLAPGDRARFLESWVRVQARFIDGPGSAVSDADQLLGDVMSTRGYPVSDFEQRAADISVDHPRILENYRAAHHGALRRGEGQSSTEDLRQVMIHYRTLFEELVGEPGAALP